MCLNALKRPFKVLPIILLMLANTAFYSVSATDNNDSTGGYIDTYKPLITCESMAFRIYGAEFIDADSTFISSFHDYLNTWSSDQPYIYKSAKYAGNGSVKMLLFEDTNSFSMPCNNNLVTSHYGWRGRRMHIGTDVDLETGDEVYAVMDGVVRFSAWNSGYGNCVIIRHLNGLETLYAHLSKLDVNAGDYVAHGALLGLGGSTGHSTGSHLHFEVHFMGHAINPELIFDFGNKAVKTLYIQLNTTGKAKAFNLENSINEEQETIFVDESSKDDIVDFDEHEKEEVKAPELVKDNASKKLHYVKKGDTLFSLSKKYSKTVDELKQKNKLTSNNLKIGQKLKI